MILGDMARRAALLVVFLLIAIPVHAGDIHTTVDSRVEFLSAVARNAGFDEYRMPNASSPYSQRVDELLAPQLKHPAFDAMRAMRRDHGLSYDAVMSLAMHVTDPPELRERISFDTHPANLDQRLVAGPTRALLVQLRDLAKVVGWDRFMVREVPIQRSAAAALSRSASQYPVLPWLEANLGPHGNTTCGLVAGLLAGGQNYGVGIQFPDGRPGEIRPVIGCSQWDAEGNPQYGGNGNDRLCALVAHEFCHSWANPLVDRHAEEFRPVGERLFKLSRAQMERQAYGTWKTCMYETVVRALAIRCTASTISPTFAADLAKSDMSRGFGWVPALAEAIAPALASRKAGEPLDGIVPLVVQVLSKEADRLADAAARAPKLLSSTPADGAQDVPPGPVTLVLVFDRPMRTDSHSIVGSAPDLPAGIAIGKVRDDGRTWEFNGSCEPGRTYTIGINGGRFRGFKSKDGVELEPVTLRFTTRAK